MPNDSNRFRRQMRAAIISVIVGLGMFAMKMAGYHITGSAAILSDAMESVVHVLATTFAFYSVLISARPADDSHPYGHGKIEFFSAGLEGLLIMLAALSIVYTATPKLFEPPELPDLGVGTVIIAAAAVINLILGWYLIHVGKRENSLTLVADGKHVLTDSITSFAVVAGLILVLVTDWRILDPIVALAVAGNIVVTGFRLMRESVSGLMDEADPNFVATVTEVLNRERKAEWVDVHRLRCWRSGETRHLDFHLTLPYYMGVAQAHHIETELTATLTKALDRRVQLLLHHDPCVPTCCSFCAVEDCQVRQQKLVEQRWFDPNQVTCEAQYLDDAGAQIVEK